MAGLTPFLSSKHLNALFLIGASFIAIGIPFSLVMMSMGTIGVSVVYILEGGFKEKLGRLNHPVLKPIIALILLFVVALLWTSDLKTGARIIRKVIPLLVIPLVFSGISSVSKRQINLLIWAFVAATVLSVLINIGVAFSADTLTLGNPRKISLFVSHIRLSLYIVLSIVWVCYSNVNWALKILIVSVLSMFVFLAQTVTGMILLFVISMAVLLGVLTINGNQAFKYFRLIFSAIILVVFGFLAYTTYDFYNPNFPEATPEFTENGKRYNPELENGFMENGNFLWSYVSFSELDGGFKSATGRSIWAENKDGNENYGVLIRYLNNKGLKKNAAGISQLDFNDFQRILLGSPYPDVWKYRGFSKRVRGLLFHLEKSRFSTDFRGNSIAEKIVFQTAGWKAYLNSPIIGAGTGDMKEALAGYYDEAYPNLPDERRRKPHNQYISYLVLAGPLALFLLIMIFVQQWRNVPAEFVNFGKAFVIIVLVSFLGEDTIGSQAGVTFVAFFSGLLFLLKPRDESE